MIEQCNVHLMLIVCLFILPLFSIYESDADAAGAGAFVCALNRK